MHKNAVRRCLVFFVHIDLPVKIPCFSIQTDQFPDPTYDVYPVAFYSWGASGIGKGLIPCFSIGKLPFLFAIKVNAG